MVSEGQYYSGLGRRKASTARVRLYPGSGGVIINGRPAEAVIPREILREDMLRPLVVTGTRNGFTVQVLARGGGITGWAGAIRLGIARALLKVDGAHRSTLRQHQLLTRDARVKERKKPGLVGARRAKQFTKR